MLTAVLIFLATLTLVIWQPRGLGIGWSATLGAAAAMMAGVVTVADIPVVWRIIWNATAAFICIIIISLLLDEAGFFEWIALHVARWGGGNGRRLFGLIILLGAAVSGLFANDGAALILTPIVISILFTLGFGPGSVLAFVMAAGFIADSASLPLVVSNLVNIVSADFFGISFSEYARTMFWVNIVSVAASLVVLRLYFRKSIPLTYQSGNLQNPNSVIRDHLTFRAGWVVMVLLLTGFFMSEDFGIPVSAIAGVGALALTIVAWGAKRISVPRVMKDAPWEIVVFSLGMYLVVYGLRNQGLTGQIAELLDVFASGGVWSAAFGTGFLTALLSLAMNNLPTVLIGALSIDASSASGVVREAMVYANVIGSDIGPKITPIGSLATLLWLHVLERKGIRVSWGYYFRVGIVITVPVLAITLAALAIRLTLF